MYKVDKNTSQTVKMFRKINLIEWQSKHFIKKKY